MKSREKGLQYGIILFLLINIIIGLSGYVHAAPSQNKDPSTNASDTGGIQLDSREKPPPTEEVDPTAEPPVARSSQNSSDSSESDPGDEEEVERAAWTKLEPDPPDESEFARKADEADFGPPIDGGLSEMVCLVKWRNTDNLINVKDESVGWYDTLGTVLSTVAIIAIPSAKLRSQENGTTADWYVRSVLVSLSEKSNRKRLGKSEVRTVYHPRFRASRDASHRLALILLKTPLDAAPGVKMAPLVANPLVPMLDEKSADLYDDYAVTACTMVVFTIDSVTKKFTLGGIPAVITKCVWNESPSANAAYEDKICVHLKIPFVPMEMLSDRMFYPNDMGAPLFCNGLLSGVYVGVQNLKGNRNGNNHLTVGTDREALYSGRLIAPDEQYVFEIPGGSSNWKFISGFTDQTEKLTWHSTMTVLQEEKCTAPLDLGPGEPEPEQTFAPTTAAPMTEPPDDSAPREKPAAPAASPKKGRSARKDDKSGAPAPPLLPALAAVATLLGVVGVVV